MAAWVVAGFFFLSFLKEQYKSNLQKHIEASLNEVETFIHEKMASTSDSEFRPRAQDITLKNTSVDVLVLDQNKTPWLKVGSWQTIDTALQSRDGTSFDDSFRIAKEKAVLHRTQKFHGKTFYLFAQGSSESYSKNIHDLRLQFGLCTMIGLVISFVFGSLASSRTSEEIRKMLRYSRRLKEGSYGDEIDLDSNHELRDLAAPFKNLKEELERKTEAIQKEQELLRTILGQIEDAVFVLNQKHDILYMNSRVTDLLGPEHLRIQSQNFDEKFRNRHLQELISKAWTTKGQDEKSFTSYHQGQERLYQAYSSFVGLGHGSAVVLIVRDLSRAKKEESLRKDFVANASHELRTPLAAILGYIDTMIQNPDMDEKTRNSFLAKVHRNVTHLTNLIRDLLELSQIENTPILKRNQVQISMLLDRALDQLQADLKKKSIEIQIHLDPHLSLFTEETLFLRILVNLLDNAVRYSPVGGQVSIHAQELEGRFNLEIEDQGIGIPEKDLPKIFDRFFRSEMARSQSPQGSGLGLSIVKRICTHLGGSIEVDSEVNQGTRVRVGFPLDSASEPLSNRTTSS